MFPELVSGYPSRRDLLKTLSCGFGYAALVGLTTEAAAAESRGGNPLSPRQPHFAPRARRVIFLCMRGGPSHVDTFDHKPQLTVDSGQPAPDKKGRKLMGSPWKFSEHGESGLPISELFPQVARHADDLCILNGMQTDVFNHGPAKIFVNTGSPQTGRPSMGSWLTYGIGNEADDLPGFVVLQSGPRGPRNGAQLWSSGFLPTTYQGVALRKGTSPILNLKSPAGIGKQGQAEFVSAIRDMNELRFAQARDPEILTRIASYEMAYRMQISAPELMDISNETQATLDAYAVTLGQASFAANCLLARRLVERGVRFVQLYHTNWDHHGGTEDINTDLPIRCQQIDQPIAALVTDLKQRGMLDETLVVWGGEFGRTPMGEVRDTVGRDHHIEAYTMWMAGAGIRPGMTYGSSDELAMGVAEGAVHVHDMQATILHSLGLDHTKLVYRHQGREFRLTDVFGRVVEEILL